MTRILHTADTHLGYRQYGLEERREDFSRAFQQIIEIAISEKADALVHAGDLFDERYVSAEDLRDTLQALFQLRAAEIPFLGVVGNHEQRRGVQWIDLFAGLGLAVHLSLQPYMLGQFKFYGMDYSGRRALALPKLQEKQSVLVMHQMLDKAQPMQEAELKWAELAQTGASLVLLGDYHEHRVWHEGETMITYAGSSERWALNESSPRGVSLIDLESHRLDRRELQTRLFLFIRENEDPIKGIDAHAKMLHGAVVVVYLKEVGYTVGEIEEHGLSKGALAVRVRDLRRPGLMESEAIAVGFEMENLDQKISERLDREHFSRWAHQIDSVIRDERIADSRVDDEVSRYLEKILE
jgi:DNA repair exonuclease SbcCD nuclease subunit